MVSNDNNKRCHPEEESGGANPNKENADSPENSGGPQHQQQTAKTHQRKSASLLLPGGPGRSSPAVTTPAPSDLTLETSKPTPGELRVAQYEKPLTKGHCPKKYLKTSEAELKDKSEALAKRRNEKRERSHVLKEKITKLIESGLQLSEYQARKAFSVYLHCILQKLSDYEDNIEAAAAAAVLF